MSWMKQRKRAARRKQMARALLALIGLCAVMFAVGIALPVEHRTTLRGSFDRPPEAVWRVLTDLDGMPMWRSDVTRVERLPDAGGRTTWREVGRTGDVIVELAESEPPRRLVTHRLKDGRPALPELTFQLTAAGPGTSVTVMEREEVGNPLGRLLVRLGARASPAARLLRDLAYRLNVNRRQMAADGAARDGH
jgi:uncharacterized protein YndB with AHSA1/START domain